MRRVVQRFEMPHVEILFEDEYLALVNKPPVLVIEKPPGFKLSMARDRMQELEKAYPDYKTDFVRGGLPDALLRELDRTAQTYYEYLLEPARDLVLGQLQKADDGDKETASKKHLEVGQDIGHMRTLDSEQKNGARDDGLFVKDALAAERNGRPVRCGRG